MPKVYNIDIPDRLDEAIEEFKEAEYIRHRSEAVRRLLNNSLRRWKAHRQQEGGMQ